MAKYIQTDKLQDNLFIPVKLGDLIIRESSANTIEYPEDNKIDLSVFEKNKKIDITGRPAYNPNVLLKLVLYASAGGIISSRKIYAFTKDNLIAMVPASP